MPLTVPNLTNYSQSIGAQASASPSASSDSSQTSGAAAATPSSKGSMWTSLLTSVLSSSGSSNEQPASTLDVNSLLSNSKPKTNPVIYIAIIVVLFVMVIGGVLIYKATKK